MRLDSSVRSEIKHTDERDVSSHSLSLQDIKNKRNPRLVPYVLLDERTKKSNKDSLREAVRTLLGYGYNLEAPDQDHGTWSLALTIRTNTGNKTQMN